MANHREPDDIDRAFQLIVDKGEENGLYKMAARLRTTPRGALVWVIHTHVYGERRAYGKLRIFRRRLRRWKKRHRGWPRGRHAATLE